MLMQLGREKTGKKPMSSSVYIERKRRREEMKAKSLLSSPSYKAQKRKGPKGTAVRSAPKWVFQVASFPPPLHDRAPDWVPVLR